MSLKQEKSNETNKYENLMNRISITFKLTMFTCIALTTDEKVASFILRETLKPIQ